jgi:hypothetical protein
MDVKAIHRHNVQDCAVLYWAFIFDEEEQSMSTWKKNELVKSYVLGRVQIDCSHTHDCCSCWLFSAMKIISRKDTIYIVEVELSQNV